jgi:CubicO group peptidase (beta-lactamase class C family)
MHLSILIIIAMLFPLLVGATARGAQPGTPAMPRSDLTDATPLPLTYKRRAAFEAYVADALYRFGVPGAAIAVVQNGDVVYLNGFGVKEVGSTRPVTPDTMMMIGSITKSMTTMLAAALVDDGHLARETRLVDLLPEFAVDDPALTKDLTVRGAFCNCSGVPALNLETYFESSALTPERWPRRWPMWLQRPGMVSSSSITTCSLPVAATRSAWRTAVARATSAVPMTRRCTSGSSARSG